ncbi:MAG: MazG family protein [Micromonosporaceae bacterium]|nr:MazG family protein [Micromonosporaceae bacterium]
MPDRIVLLVTSPRLPAGLLTAQAWDLVRAAPVYAAADSPQAGALRAAGVEVKVVGGEAQVAAEALLADPAPTVVWLAGPDGDPAVARRVGLRLASEPGSAELELVYGSWDPPGARLLDVVAVMDRLRSPGGCPWDAEQTHRSLAHYLLEEVYEAYDEMVRGDLAALREELGDVLLQVAFHSRIAEELPDDERWSIDDVAGDLVEKLVRRHPHVFSSVEVDGAEHVAANWEEIKKAEKSRESVMDGVALSQPALALAAKLLSRARKAGIAVPVPEAPADPTRDEPALGATLLAQTAAAGEAGLDAEGALRQAALTYAKDVRKAESQSV